MSEHQTPAPAPLCRCGHGKAYHDAKYNDPQCRLCPEDGERVWRHPYTPETEQSALAPLSPEREAEPYRDDVRDPLQAAGWRETTEGFVIAENGALWTETNDCLDSGLGAPDNSWTVAFDSGVPGSVVAAAALAAGGVDVLALLAELDRTRAELDELKQRVAELDRALDEVMAERDHAEEVADKLAYAIAPIEIIGEHSSGNSPWLNALDIVTPAARVAELEQRVAELVLRGLDEGDTAPCGHDDYHDAHEWADKPGVWCPGHSFGGGAR